MKIQVKIKTTLGRSDEELLVDAKGSVIKQSPEYRSFELVDLDSQFAPQSITVKRSGQNLEIAFEQDDHATLLIEDYYANEQITPIIGTAEDGKQYSYVPISGEIQDSFAELKEDHLASEVLGTAYFDEKPFFSSWGWVALGFAAALTDSIISSKRNKNKNPQTEQINELPVVEVGQEQVSVTPSDSAVNQQILYTADGSQYSLQSSKNGSSWAASELASNALLNTTSGKITISNLSSLDDFAVIDYGSGSNVSSANTLQNSVNLETGDGNDQIYLKGEITQTISNIAMGAGADIFIAQDAIQSSQLSIDMGSGNDKLMLSTATTKGQLSGGEGYDVLSLFKSGGELLVHSGLTGWEQIDLNGSGANSLRLESGFSLESFIANNNGNINYNGQQYNNVLVINGDKDDSISVGSLNSSATSVEYQNQSYQSYTLSNGFQLWVDQDIQIL